MGISRRLFVIGGLSSCAAAANAQEADWEKIVQAAKQEEKVVFYTSRVGSPYHMRVISAFEKKYSIKVDVLELRGAELRERIRTEHAAGRYLADVSHNGLSLATAAAREGSYQPYGNLPNVKNLMPPFKATDMLIPAFVMSSGILINTRLVKPGDEPKSWKTLIDPKWKGKILADDMRVPGSAFTVFFVLNDVLGRDYVEKLAGQNLVFDRDIGNAERRVARGEYPIYIPQLLPEYPDLKGLPVKFVAPAEGGPYSEFMQGMHKNAPHPNAARLLLDFFLSNEAQLIYAEGLNTTVVKGIEEKLPGDARAYADLKLMGGLDVDRMQAVLKIAAELFKR